MIFNLFIQRIYALNGLTKKIKRYAKYKLKEMLLQRAEGSILLNVVVSSYGSSILVIRVYIL